MWYSCSSLKLDIEKANNTIDKLEYNNAWLVSKISQLESIVTNYKQKLLFLENKISNMQSYFDTIIKKIPTKWRWFVDENSDKIDNPLPSFLKIFKVESMLDEDDLITSSKN